MKILYLIRHYKPEIGACSLRASNTAHVWASKGEKVTIFTGWPSYPMGKLYPGYKVELLGEEYDGDVRVLRSKSFVKATKSLFLHAWEGVYYQFFGTLNLMCNFKKIGSDFDVVIASTEPFFMCTLGYKFAKKYKVPFVLEFRDITYESLVATGLSKDSLRVRLVKKIEVRLSKKADRIIVVSNGYKNVLVRDGIEPNKIDVVPNGSTLIDTKKVVDNEYPAFGYFGTLGISQNIQHTVELLGDVNKNIDCAYNIIGEGAKRELIEDLISENRYNFVDMKRGMSSDELEPYYGKIDFSIVSLVNNPAFAPTIPSKIFQSFARGIPVIYFGPEGDASDIIRKNNAGIVLSDNDDVAKSQLIEFFSNDDWKSKADAMGENAKRTLVEGYNRKTLAIKALNSLKKTQE